MSEHIKIDLFKLASSELKLKIENVKAAVDLLDEGNTVPFIARYRKEMTGSLDEEEIRNIEEKIDYLRRLNERKNEVAEAAEKQEKLNDELLLKLKKANTLQEVEDLYRPFKVKKQTKAAKAIDKGLQPLADLIFSQKKTEAEIKKIAEKHLDSEKELNSVTDVLSGAEDIIAGEISDDAELRKKLRTFVFKTAKITSEQKNEDEEGKYQDYYEFKESINKIPPHRILALNRGENENILRVKAEVSDERAIEMIYNIYKF
jgi:uncharacterized protein